MFGSSKKGSMSDAIFLMVILFIISIVSLVGYTIFTAVNDDFQANSGISSEGKSLIGDLHGKFVNFQENTFIFILVGLLAGVMIGAFFIRSHPALFWISIPVMAFIIFLGAIYANFFQNFSNTSQFSAALSEFTLIPLIMNNFIPFVTGIVLLISVALFAKNRLADNRL